MPRKDTMLDPMALIHLEADTPADQMHASTLLVSLGGYIDAGHVTRTTAEYLLEQLPHTVVATLDVDQLLDYRGRRPAMTFDADRWSAYDDPSLVLYRVTDLEGTAFLLLQGPEPDYQWERFTSAVLGLSARLGVRLVLHAYGFPMAVPHTRPMAHTAIATDQRLIPGNDPVFGQVRLPGSATALMHLRAGEMGLDGVGFAVHVPQYLADADFGDATVAALESLAAVTGLAFPMADIITRAGTHRAAIEAEMAENPEATQVVAALEQQYDQFMEARSRRSLIAKEEAKLPSADEIGAELEAFLKRATDDDPADEQPGAAPPEPAG